MAKIKSNLCGFILTLASVLTGILAFVSLAFKTFAKLTATISGLPAEAAAMGLKNGSQTQTNSLKNWLDLLKNGKDMDGISTLKVARVFMIITLVLVAIAVVLAVVKFFISNKYVDIALLVVAGLVVVSAIIMLITLLVGSNQLCAAQEKASNAGLKPLGGKASVSMVPGAIPICLIVFSVINGIIGIVLGTLSFVKKNK